jgi:hypothetical protein
VRNDIYIRMSLGVKGLSVLFRSCVEAAKFFPVSTHSTVCSPYALCPVQSRVSYPNKMEHVEAIKIPPFSMNFGPMKSSCKERETALVLLL